MRRIAVVGAAAIGDYLFHVDHLPQFGEIVKITEESGPIVPGGCAPNISAGVHSIGLAEEELYYPTGDDPESSEMQIVWKEQGIRCHITQVKGIGSGKAWLYMQPDGTTMCFSYLGAADKAEANPIDICADHFVICPVLNRFTEAYMKYAISHCIPVTVSGIADGKLIPYLGKITSVIINRYEAEILSEKSGTESIKDLSAKYPDLLLFVTSGSEGSTIYQSGEATKVPIVRAQSIRDFTGAGDAYTSGVVSALVNGFSAVSAAYIGAANSSFVLENKGGMTNMPQWSDLMERLGEQYPGIEKNIRREGLMV